MPLILDEAAIGEAIASLVGALPNLGRSSMRRKDSRMPRKDSRAPGRRNSLIGGLTSLMGGSSRRNTTMDAAAAAVAAGVALAAPRTTNAKSGIDQHKAPLLLRHQADWISGWLLENCCWLAYRPEHKML